MQSMFSIARWKRVLAGFKTFNRKRQHRNRTHSSAQPVVVEALEDRTLLAGNVLAIARGGDLVLRGDSADNSVAVLLVNGALTVQGFDNTTINGASSFTVTTNATLRDDFVVRLGGGNDTLTLLDGITIRDDISIDLGEGDDLVSLSNTIVNDDVVIRGRRGNDQVTLSNLIARDDVVVSLSSGDDILNVDGGSVGDDFAIRMDEGADDVVLNNVSVTDDARILTGSEADRVVVQNGSVGDDLAISGGRNNDFVNVSNTSVGDDVGLFGASGDDTLVAEGSNQFGDDLRLDGGRGTDAVSVDNATTIGDSSRVRSESTTVDALVITTNTNATTASAQVADDASAAIINPTAIADLFDLENNNTLTIDTANGVLSNDTESPLGGTSTASIVTNAGNGNVTLNADGSFTYVADNSFNGTDTFTYQASDEFGGSDTAQVQINVSQVDLALDLSSNGALQSNGTLVTNNSTFTVAGTTEPGATVEIDRDGDDAFDDGTATADDNGDFSIDVTLLNDSNNLGANNLMVRSTVGGGGSRTVETDVHFAEGSVVRFDLSIGGAPMSYDVELLDEDAPNVVANFLNYVNDGDYVNSLIHRSVNTPTFQIIQGGGFTFDSSDNTVANVPTDAPVNNEFDPANSNVRGTLSTAQIGGDINSFTSQYFINVFDNVGLDNVPHTVFGRVIGTGMDVVDAINNIPTFDVSTELANGALGEVPLTNNYEAGTTPTSANVVTVSTAVRILAPPAN